MVSGALSESHSYSLASDGTESGFTINLDTVLSLPDLSAYGSGNIHVVSDNWYLMFGSWVHSVTAYDGPAGTSIVMPSLLNFGAALQRTTTITKDTAFGLAQIGQISGTTDIRVTGYALDTCVGNTLKRTLFHDLPANVSTVILQYRPAGSTSGWSRNQCRACKWRSSRAGLPLTGAAARGNYEIRYTTLDASFNVLNAGAGTMLVADGAPLSLRPLSHQRSGVPAARTWIRPAGCTSSNRVRAHRHSRCAIDIPAAAKPGLQSAVPPPCFSSTLGGSTFTPRRSA
jgi:hypothetical protein